MALDVLARRYLEKAKPLNDGLYFGEFDIADDHPTKNCISQGPKSTVNISFGPLTRSHFEVDKTSSKWCFDGDVDFIDELCTEDRPSNDVCFDSNFVKEKCKNSGASLGLLARNHLKNHKTLNELHVDGDLNFSDVLSTDVLRNDNEALLDEIAPDIDLSFCIKTNCIDKLSPDSTSPESVDSGFNELESILIESTSSPEKKCLNTDGLFGKENLNRSKQSLLSKAISAKLKIDDVRQAKLKKIGKEFLKKQLLQPFIDFHQQSFPTECKIIDHSDNCVVASSFLTIQN